MAPASPTRERTPRAGGRGAGLRLVTDDEPRARAERGARGMDVTWHQAVADWTTALRAAGRSPATITLYRHYLYQAGERLGGTPWDVRPAQLEHLLGSVEWGPTARKSLRTALGGFYRWAHLRELVERDPTTTLPTVRVPRGRPRPTPEGIFIDALERADQRTRYMLELGGLAGLRAGEISRVHTDDLYDDVLLVHGKGAKDRRVPLPDGDLLEAIASARGWLFPNVQRGGHITPNHVSKLLSRHLPAPWTGHTLRHRFGTRAFAGSRDLLAVSQLLGHASTETTLIYVQLPEDHLRDAVRAAAVMRAA